MSDLLQQVKDHMYANYDKWNMVIECHEDHELIEWMGKATTLKSALKNIEEGSGLELYREQEQAVKNEVF